MEPTKEDHLNKENTEKDTNDMVRDAMKKRNYPTSSLSSSDGEQHFEDQEKVNNDASNKKVKREGEIEEEVENASFDENLKEILSLPTLKIQPILGGKPLSFPVHPRLTLIDLRDFILFALNIPHPQQILSFYSAEADKNVILSNYSENTLLCSIPGLIDEVTGRCAPVGLSFKISSGMDFSVHPSDVEYEAATCSDSVNEFSAQSYFEICNSDETDPTSLKLSALASSIASLVPLPPGIDKSSRMLFRSLSKSSPTNSNLPTLWEIYFPESGVKMMVTALINVNEAKENEGEAVEDNLKTEAVNVPIESKANTAESTDDLKESSSPKTPAVPALVITPPPNQASTLPSPTPASILANSDSTAPKIHCEKCRIKCRPALRFTCKCNKTFCQSHRYPDQHNCTFDHRADGMATIQANNPKIVKDKVGNF